MPSIVKGKVYTLEELLILDKGLEKRIEYNKIKSKVRHEKVSEFNDLDKDSKKLLLRLKKEVFNGEAIYLSGSRIKGTYLTEKEFQDNKLKYPNVKRSDWDIFSEYNPDKNKLKEFEEKENIKIDFQIGKIGVII